MVYRVLFENLDTATAPAAEISVTDVLDPAVDPATFRVRSIKVGHAIIDVPPGHSSFDTVLDLLDSLGLLAGINAAVDGATRTVRFTLTALDPETRQLPMDPLRGILPPNDDSGQGEGYVEFSVQPRASTQTGTIARNKASIVFDYNDPIETNEVSNTIDAAAPQSAVQSLPAQRATPFVVRWTAQDDTGGSGVAAVDVFVKTDAGAFERWLTSTGDWDYFDGEVGKTYSFYAIGKDNVGNVESVPATPDAATTVTAARRDGDMDYDGDTDLTDLGMFAQCFRVLPDQSVVGGPDLDVGSACAEADLKVDGRVDLEDFAKLQNGFCPCPAQECRCPPP